MANAKRGKKGSVEIDRLIAEVDKLNAGGLSINKACAKIGLQPTVYYFRKRKDEALANAKEVLPSNYSSNNAKSLSTTELHDHKDFDALKKEARELEMRLNSIKLALANKMLSKEL